MTATKFKPYQHISVTTSPPVYKRRRKSITIVINYPDYYHNDFTGLFELKLLDVDEPDGETRSLYYDTMREVWDVNLDWWNGPFEFTLAETNAINENNNLIEGDKNETN